MFNIDINFKNEYTSLQQILFNNIDFALCKINIQSLVTIAGRPTMGKRAFAIFLMLKFLKKNKKCLYFSIEQNRDSIIKQLICQTLGTFTPDLSKEINQKEIDLIVNNNNLIILDENINISKIREQIEVLRPNYVFVDNLQGISSSKNNHCITISAIMQELKQVAINDNCTVFVLSELSRNLECREDKHPTLTDFRDSGATVELSDVILFVHRDNDSHNSNDLYYPKEIEIIVAKNKMTSSDIIKLPYKDKIYT